MNEIFDFWERVDKPEWLKSANYLTVMGSRAYGTNTDSSDWDFYGFTTPPAEIVFPHLSGEILDFGNQKKRFNQLQLQGVDSQVYGDTDLTVYNIVRYFHLLMGGNPNMIDSLFVPDDAIIYMDNIGAMVRQNRHTFLSQKMFHTFKGMVWSHMKRITSRAREGKRKEWVEKFGYDVKDASHVVRLMKEVESFLFHGDADISENSDYILSVRNGEWDLEFLRTWFEVSLKNIELRMEDGHCVLPKYPDTNTIKEILVYCLEESYGGCLSRFGYNIL